MAELCTGGAMVNRIAEFPLYPINKTNTSIPWLAGSKGFQAGQGREPKDGVGLPRSERLAAEPRGVHQQAAIQGVHPRPGLCLHAVVVSGGPGSFFQNINMLAKVFRNERPSFYGKVTDIRSQMTRIKLWPSMTWPPISSWRTSYQYDQPKFKYTHEYDGRQHPRRGRAEGCRKARSSARLTDARLVMALKETGFQAAPRGRLRDLLLIAAEIGVGQGSTSAEVRGRSEAFAEFCALAQRGIG